MLIMMRLTRRRVTDQSTGERSSNRIGEKLPTQDEPSQPPRQSNKGGPSGKTLAYLTDSVDTDVLIEIAGRLARADLARLILTCTRIHALLWPVLYKRFHLASSERCQVTLTMLQEKKQICRVIRELSVDPTI
ncbi:hypothetical protein FA15DRAFT_50757 [Coprinopsis marcescibilis]|uniref:F-box domain-containing protein n=1 Tax=Coprinopsis marcescibilis TaxID=230819 RepID=A0A5C3KNW2_COPMA|nr:hypothetical protein FA15DRAFT_50757 [Coprinopsis marcescibilis]